MPHGVPGIYTEVPCEEGQDTTAEDGLSATFDFLPGLAAAAEREPWPLGPRVRRRGLAAGLLAVLGVAWWSRHHAWRQAGATTGEADNVVSLVGLTTNIRWLAHPTKCLDVAGKTHGAALQLWDCDPDYPYQQGFFVPPDGTTGRIKWALHPNLCLDYPGGHNVQFWDCDKAPPENLLWTVSPDGEGRIHLASDPTQCLDVPDAKTENGWKLQVWECTNATRQGKDSNLRFVTHPVDCKWDHWSNWGACSASCGGGIHLRSRSVARPALNGGKECGFKSDDTERCNIDPCPVKDNGASAPGTTAILPQRGATRVKRSGARRQSAVLWAWLLALGPFAAWGLH